MNEINEGNLDQEMTTRLNFAEGTINRIQNLPKHASKDSRAIVRRCLNEFLVIRDGAEGEVSEETLRNYDERANKLEAYFSR